MKVSKRGALYITYLVGVVILAESIPYPTSSQQLNEAEMFDRTIHIEGNSKENPEQVLRMDLDQVSNESEKITGKSINKICKSNDGGKKITCADAE